MKKGRPLLAVLLLAGVVVTACARREDQPPAGAAAAVGSTTVDTVTAATGVATSGSLGSAPGQSPAPADRATLPPARPASPAAGAPVAATLTPVPEHGRNQSSLDTATPAPASQATATGQLSPTSGPSGTPATVGAMPSRTPPSGTPVPSPATPVVWSQFEVLGPENVAEIAQIGALGRGSARDLAWSPGGQSLAVATSQGIDLYDVETASWGARLPTQAGVLRLAWDPGGDLLAAGQADGTARIWEAGSGTLLHSLWGHGQAVSHVVFAPDGRWLISGGSDGTLRAWDTASGQEVRRLAVQSLHQVLLSPDGRWIATGGGKWQRQVQVWDLDTGEMGHELEISPDLLDMAFSPDGKTLAVVESWGQSPPVLLLDLDGGQVQRLDFAGAVRSIAWSPDGALLATGGAGLYLRLWDASTGELAGTLATGEEWPYELAFSPDGTRLAASGETEVRVWDLVTGQIEQVLATHATRDLAFDPGGGRLAWRAGNAVRLLDLVSGQIHDPPGHAGPIASLAFGIGGRLLAVGDWDGSIQLWQLGEGQGPSPGQVVRRMVGHASPVGTLAFSPDGHTLASGGMNEDQQIRLWDVGTGQVVAELAGDANYPAGSLAFTPDGGTLAGGGARQVILWDLDSGQERRLDGHKEGILSLAISPNGQRLASGSFDTTVIVWDLASGRELHTLPGHTLGAASLAFSPDGALLVSGDQGGAVRVWEAATGQLLQTIQGRGSDLAFSPNGDLLAFKGSLDDIVLWDVIRGRELRRLPGHRPLAFSPNGQALVVGTREGTVEVWAMSQ